MPRSSRKARQRLERARFASLFRDAGKSAHIMASELALFIEGCELVGTGTLSPGIVKPKVLALERAV